MGGFTELNNSHQLSDRKMILDDLSDVRLLFQDIVLSKIDTISRLCSEADSQSVALNQILATICLSCVFEYYNVLYDLMSYNNLYGGRSLISQRQTYFSSRYVLESAADLLWLKRHPEELENFISDSSVIAREVNEVNKNKDIRERDSKFADILRNGSRFRLEKQTIERIGKIFPGEGIGQYAILCLMTHTNDIGNLMYVVKDWRDMAQMLLHNVRSLRVALPAIEEYLSSNMLLDIKAEEFIPLEKKLRELENELLSYLSQHRTIKKKARVF